MAKVALVEAAPPESESPAPARGGKRKLIVVVLMLLALGGGGFGAWKYLGAKAGEHPAEKPLAELPPVFVPIEQFTVNLNPDGGEQFLQTAFTLKVTDLDVVEAVKLRLPDLRNQILLLLSSKKAAELTTVEGKQKLAGEILVAANEVILPSFPVAKKPAEAKAKDGEHAKAREGEPAKVTTPTHAVTGVLFTHFIIQ
jgi:flagellar protein FliL